MIDNNYIGQLDTGHEDEPRRRVYPKFLRHGRNTNVVSPIFPVVRVLVQIVAFLLVVSALVIVIFATSAYSTYAHIAASLKPRLLALQNREVFETSRIYDRNGVLLYEFFDTGKRTRVNVDDVSPLLIAATISIEDKTFFSNPGVDYEGIMRAFYQSVSAGEERGGASTITQQVIKNIILTEEERRYENRYERKFKEIVLAQELSQLYDKKQILELYLNEIFYGNLAYGIEAASNVYFGVHANELTLAQASLLAGLPQLPTVYDPLHYVRRDEDRTYLLGIQLGDGWVNPSYSLSDTVSPPKWRQVAVLRQMVDEGYVSEAQARAAATEDLVMSPQEAPLHAPHFVFYVRKILEEKYGKRLVTGGGLNIYTTLDLDLQRMIQKKAAEHIKSLEERNIYNAAIVAMQPNTGQILSMVGSIDYDEVKVTDTPGEEGNVIDGQVNVAIRERQPGSALKPFTYLAAMEQGMTPATVLWDVPTKFRNGDTWYEPKNYNGRWNGPVRIRTALANSLNMPAVKALKFAGIEYTLDLLDRVGVKNGLKRGMSYYGLSLTLGGGEITLLELTTAYNTLASGGQYIPPTPILKVTDNTGHVLESAQNRTAEQVLDPALTSVIVDMMSDDKARAPIWGLNSELKLSRPSAVKTGTSEDWRDAWTVGFTPYVTVGVWSGNNNNEPTDKVESLQGGGIIWHNVMEELFTWLEDDTYRTLFGSAFADGELVEDFSLDDAVQRSSLCSIPGNFGGYSEELFTTGMLHGTNVISGTVTADVSGRGGKIHGGCDFYTKFTVVKIPNDESVPTYCLPVKDVSYPPEMVEVLTYWNVPDSEPDERVVYQWSGGSAGTSVRPGSFPQCTTAVVKKLTPTPNPEERLPTPSSSPTTMLPAPVSNAVAMPDLLRMGENQAKEVLASLGVNDVYIEYQTRDRIPQIFDQYAPYTVVSTLPTAGNWVLPRSMVILRVRAPDQQPAGEPAPVAPTSGPAPGLQVVPDSAPAAPQPAAPEQPQQPQQDAQQLPEPPGPANEPPLPAPLPAMFPTPVGTPPPIPPLQLQP